MSTNSFIDYGPFIDSQPTKVESFDESIVKRMLKKSTVYDKRILFEFHSGVSVEVNM